MRDVIMYITLVINVVSLFGMIGGILLHSGRGGGLSDMFGGASGAAFGLHRRRAEPQPDHVRPRPHVGADRDRAGSAAHRVNAPKRAPGEPGARFGHLIGARPQRASS